VNIDVLFAGVSVTDLETALEWYQLLLGRPCDIIVNDDEVMWRVADSGWVYVVIDRQRAGKALVALAVADLDATLAEIADRGLRSSPIEIVGDGGRKATFSDPDGNLIAYIEVTTAAEDGTSSTATDEPGH
jgi:predicted enzyme related to lactoylglutathione lyase